QSPNTAAANVLPTAAAANQSVFYDKFGEARSLREIYQRFAQKFDGSLTQNAYTTQNTTPLKPANVSHTVASGSQIAVDVANMLSTHADATIQAASVVNTICSLRSQTRTDNTAFMSANSSALFDAMIIGQIQETGIHTTSPLAAYDGRTDEEKRNAYSILSAVV
ncbi:MAG: hypothetical protein WC464_05850, partial [Bdellovibrionales bacterium]